MRTFAVLCLLGFASADLLEKAKCLIDSGEAVSDATDAALFIWAADKRCSPSGNAVKCEVDVSSAVKAVTSMVNVIMGSISKCGELHVVKKECGLQAGQVTQHTAGLAAAVGDVYQKCANVSEPVKPSNTPVACTIDLKDSAKGLFKVSKLLTEGEKCEGGVKDCAADVLNLVGALGGMGQYIAGAVGQCNRSTALNPNATAQPEGELCAQAVLAIVAATSELSQDGMVLADKCAPAPPPVPAPAPPAPQGHPPVIMVQTNPGRLFEQSEDDEEDTGSSMNLVLGAFLPVTAIVGFVGGRFYATRNSRDARIVEQAESI